MNITLCRHMSNYSSTIINTQQQPQSKLDLDRWFSYSFITLRSRYISLTNITPSSILKYTTMDYSPPLPLCILEIITNISKFHTIPTESKDNLHNMIGKVHLDSSHISSRIPLYQNKTLSYVLSLIPI